MRRHHILIPLAALLVVLPLIFQGCSCGHDFDFHLQSWLDAAAQLRHGTLYPHWAITPAWNAGEPRFVFYPPISWMFGALLSLVFPVAALPVLYTGIVLTAAGFAMYRCASEFTSPTASLIAAIVYLANPYMLFTAFERTAYAELLAAVWLPLLFLAVLRARPTIHASAIPLALLWLTNAPAAVMGSYSFALLACFRVVQSMRARVRAATTRTHDDGPSPASLSVTYLFGTILGLALTAFYLVPAAYERRFVQIAMAVIPNMRIQDNFLFGHTADAAHNVVLHTASLLAIAMLLLTLAFITWTILRKAANAISPRWLLALTLLITFLLTPLSLPLWLHLPELQFLQFSWRLLAIVATVLALAIALCANRLSDTPHTHQITLIATPLGALALSLLCIHLYRQPCGPQDTPRSIAQAFVTGHGVNPTDEYTPNDADNDVIRPNEPAYWLTDDPQSFALNTTINPGATDPNFDGTFPATQTLSAPAPHDLHIPLANARYLVLNLRDYPEWEVSESDNTSRDVTNPEQIHRDDGLIAIPLDYGSSDVWIHIRWRTTGDQFCGYILSILALISLAALLRRHYRAI